MNQEQIIAAVEMVSNKVRQKFGSRFVTPKVTFGAAKGKTLGLAFQYANRVDFNLSAAALNGESFLDVVIHEIAHIAQYVFYPMAKQAHGPEFRRICSMLGGSGETKAIGLKVDASTIKVNMVTRYSIKCACGTHYLSKQRATDLVRGTVYRCNVCAGKLDPNSGIRTVKVKSTSPKYVAFSAGATSK